MEFEEFKRTVGIIQRYDLELILEVNRICEKHNLRYCLAYGTMLGAVRHKGFIPWDDDADLYMPYEDYQKFVALVPEELDNRFRFEDITSMPDNIVPWGKILYKNKIENDYPRQGLDVHHELSIDIFPLYSFPNVDRKIKNLGRKTNRYFHVLIGKTRWKNRSKIKYLLNRIYGLIHFGSKNFYKHKIINIIEKYKECNSEFYIAPTVDGKQKDNFYPKEWFKEMVLMDFEGHKLPVPKEYDLYLKQMYNDYMSLPPEDKRWNANHDIISCNFGE